MSVQQSSGGMKGFFQRAAKSFKSAGVVCQNSAHWVASKGATIGFILVTTTMITLLPLLFEIGREGQMLETDRITVKEYRGRGYSDRQLQEMGFSDSSLHSPSVAVQK